jgi:hypothetical protein
LRTVIWDFAGEEVPADITSRVSLFTDRACAEEVVAGLLDDDEVGALVQRARALEKNARFPIPSDDYRHYPWPLV